MKSRTTCTTTSNRAIDRVMAGANVCSTTTQFRRRCMSRLSFLLEGGMAVYTWMRKCFKKTIHQVKRDNSGNLCLIEPVILLCHLVYVCLSGCGVQSGGTDTAAEHTWNLHSGERTSFHALFVQKIKSSYSRLASICFWNHYRKYT